MSTPETLRWWADQIRRCTKEFYFSHVLVADLNYGADEIEKLENENAKLRELVQDMFGVISRNNSWWDGTAKDTSRLSARMREIGIGKEKKDGMEA